MLKIKNIYYLNTDYQRHLVSVSVTKVLLFQNIISISSRTIQCVLNTDEK